MKRIRLRGPRLWTCLIAAATLALGLPRAAHATLTLQLDAGGPPVTVVDGGAGDLNPTGGSILFLGTVGPFQVIATVTSKPIIGSSSAAVLDLSAVITGTAGGTLSLSASDTSFSLPSSPVEEFISDLGGVTNGTLTAQQCADLTNVLFGCSLANNPQGPFGPGPFANEQIVSFDYLGSPFSITENVSVTQSSGGQITSFNLQSTVDAPEPTMLLLLGVGFGGVALWGRVQAGPKGRGPSTTQEVVRLVP